MQELLENQRENLFLYVPFVMAFGAALYFSGSSEPNLIICCVMAVVAFWAAAFLRLPIIVRGILLFIFGFCYACAYTDILNTPVMPRNIPNKNITGRVVALDHTADKHRIFIRVPNSELNIKSDGAAIVRVSIASDTLPDIGDEISTRATLFKPNPPDIRGGFDFARWAYFSGISATGYIDDFETITPNQNTTMNGVRDWLHRFGCPPALDTFGQLVDFI